MSGGVSTRLGAMAAVWGALLLWSLFADQTSCMLSAVSLMVATALLTGSATEVAFYRRRAFLSHYLVPEGLLFRLLGRRLLILTWHTAKSLVLAVLLLLATLDLTPLDWLILLADVFLMTYLLVSLSRFLGHEVKAPYPAPMARHWATWINAFLLWSVLVGTRFYSPQPDYQGLLWEEVSVLGASQTVLGCDALAVLARIKGVAEALTFWAAQNLFGTLQRPTQVLLAWLVFLASFGVSFFLAWLYSRALAGAVARPFRVWQDGR